MVITNNMFLFLKRHGSKILTTFSLFLMLLAAFGTLPVSAQTTAQLTPSRDIICGGPCPLFDGNFRFDRDGLALFLLAFARFLTFIGVGLAVLFLVFAGLQYIFGKEEEAKKNIVTTLIGLVIIIVAYTFVTVLAQFLQGNALGSALSSGSF